MKTMRKSLGILLVLAMLCTLFVGTVSAADPVTVKTIDESGNLTNSKIAPDGMPDGAVDIDYLSDRTDAPAVTGSASFKKNLTYGNAPNMVYLYPNRYLPEGVTNSKGSTSARVQLSSTHTVSAPRVETVYGDTEATNFVYQYIYMGGYATYYEKGLGVHPAATGADLRSLIYPTNGAEYFYAVVGGTGGMVTNPDTSVNDGTKYCVQFKVYGSNAVDGTFDLLAQSDNIYWWYTAEFNVDISAYSYIKLEVVYNGSNNIDSCACAWGNACVYNIPSIDYTVTYDGNGGKTSADLTTLTDAENITNSTAASLTVKADANTFVKTGYSFNGWNTKADGTGTAYAVDADIALTAAAPSVTLYAQWIEDSATKYTVTYMNGTQVVGTQQVLEGGNASAPAVPDKEGHDGAWDHDGKNITADTTINAVYTIKKYTVTVKIEGKEDATQTVEHGADAVLPEIPAKNSYEGAWDHDGKNITADTTITAVYTRKIQKATVLTGTKAPTGISSTATNVTNLADLYKQDIKDASKHELVDNPKYVVYSYVQKNGNFPDGRIFGVNTTFFPARLGSWSNGTYTYSDKLSNAPITLGEAGTVCTTGLSLQPAGPKDAKQVQLIMDISSLDVNQFYSLVGFTGLANNPSADTSKEFLPKQVLRYEVYGSKDNSEYDLLSYVEIKGSDVGEFNVNIAGYKYLKLVTKNINTDNAASQNNEAAWGNAVLYKGDQISNTADSFSFTAVAAAIVAATSVVALVASKKKFF